jgi:hypothetical protein
MSEVSTSSASSSKAINKVGKILSRRKMSPEDEYFSPI